MLCDHCRRKRGQQLAFHRCVEHEGRFLDDVLRQKFGSRKQHGKFGTRQTLAFASASEQLLVACNTLYDAVEPSSRFERFDKPNISRKITRTAGFSNRQRQRLQAIVLKHQIRYRIGHAG